jgi:adenylylsulfate kinase-like enzyme
MTVTWIIGLSGAGKTTIARELVAQRRADGFCVAMLDGDALRDVWGDNLGHTLEDRRTNAWRTCRLCKYLDSQGLDVVCAILSLFEATRAWNREQLSRYIEVFLDVPMEELKARDPRGLYRATADGRARNVAGVDLEFERPRNSDLVLANGAGADSPSMQAAKIAALLRKQAERVH